MQILSSTPSWIQQLETDEQKMRITFHINLVALTSSQEKKYYREKQTSVHMASESMLTLSSFNTIHNIAMCLLKKMTLEYIYL